MDSATMLMIILSVVALVLGALQAYHGRMLAATMWAGRASAPADFGPTPSNGVQAAITPPWQTKLGTIWMIGYVVVLIAGSLQTWYFGLLCLSIASTASTITRFLLPQ